MELHSLPSLIRSPPNSGKAAGVGFDWSTEEEVWSKVEEELTELRLK